jgi:hypothetical protein
MKVTTPPLLVVVCLVMGSCEGAQPIPTRPTWSDHVEPILRGNCFSCHGSARLLHPMVLGGGQPIGGSFLLDNCEVAAAFGFNPDGMPKPKGVMENILDAKEDGRMPPPPAERLSDRDVEVLRRWYLISGADCKRRLRQNRPPTATLLSKEGDTWQVLIEDPDGENVTGTIDFGGDAPYAIGYAGLHPNVPAPVGRTALTVKLTDSDGEGEPLTLQ